MDVQKTSFLVGWASTGGFAFSFAFFFPLITEVFGRLCIKAETTGYIQVFSPCRGLRSILYLQYADDTLMFCEASVRQVSRIKFC